MIELTPETTLEERLIKIQRNQSIMLLVVVLMTGMLLVMGVMLGASATRGIRILSGLADAKSRVEAARVTVAEAKKTLDSNTTIIRRDCLPAARVLPTLVQPVAQKPSTSH